MKNIKTAQLNKTQNKFILITLQRNLSQSLFNYYYFYMIGKTNTKLLISYQRIVAVVMQAKRKRHDVENKGLLQMQHPAVCLQGTFGDHLGGINKNETFKRR